MRKLFSHFFASSLSLVNNPGGREIGGGREYGREKASKDSFHENVFMLISKRQRTTIEPHYAI
jgi:hypothetical protein